MTKIKAWERQKSFVMISSDYQATIPRFYFHLAFCQAYKGSVKMLVFDVSLN